MNDKIPVFLDQDDVNYYRAIFGRKPNLPNVNIEDLAIDPDSVDRTRSTKGEEEKPGGQP